MASADISLRIKGPRVALWSLEARDVEYLRTLRNKLRMFFADSRVVAPEGQTKWWEDYQKNPEDWTFVIRRGSVGIGIIAVYHVDPVERTACLGRLMIDDGPIRRKGYAQEAMGLAQAFARDVLGVLRVRLDVLPDNLPARSLYLKMGFVVVGTAPEMVTMEWSVV